MPRKVLSRFDQNLLAVYVKRLDTAAGKLRAVMESMRESSVESLEIERLASLKLSLKKMDDFLAAAEDAWFSYLEEHPELIDGGTPAPPTEPTAPKKRKRA